MGRVRISRDAIRKWGVKKNQSTWTKLENKRHEELRDRQ